MSSNPYAPRDRTNEDISPFWRAFFAVFICYQLFDRVRKHNADSPAADTSAGAREDPLSINGTEVRPLASIGITFSDLGYREPGEILRDADLAMYKAKADGKGRLTVVRQLAFAHCIRRGLTPLSVPLQARSGPRCSCPCRPAPRTAMPFRRTSRHEKCHSG